MSDGKADVGIKEQKKLAIRELAIRPPGRKPSFPRLPTVVLTPILAEEAAPALL